MKFIRSTALAAIVTAAGAAAAFGQPTGYPYAPPPPVSQPPPQTALNGGVCAPPSAQSYGGAPAPPPPSYGNPYGYPTYQGAVGGALSGGADLVNAQGQYLMQQQQSRMLQTQADSARLGYRQQLIEEQKWEKAQLPTTAEILQKEQGQKLQSARNNPTDPEIWSGDSLNALFTAFQGAQAQGLSAQPVPIPPDVMKHINFTTGTNSGTGAGMLREMGELQWPFCMQAPPFLDAVTSTDNLAKKAVAEVKANGRVTAATFNALNTAVGALNDQANADQALSPTDWILATSFTSDLQSSVQSLRNPNVAGYFNGELEPQAATVPQLVQMMSAKGLKFAPATEDDKPAYTTMQQLMKAYDYRLSTLAAR